MCRTVANKSFKATSKLTAFVCSCDHFKTEKWGSMSVVLLKLIMQDCSKSGVKLGFLPLLTDFLMAFALLIFDQNHPLMQA